MPPKKGTPEYEAWKNSPEYIAFCIKQSESAKNSAQDPERRRKYNETIQKRSLDPDKRKEYIRNMKAGAQKRSRDPEWQRKNKEHREKMYQTPAWQRGNKERSKKCAQDPEWLDAVAKANRKKAQDPEWQYAHTEAMQKLAQDPEWKRNHKEGSKKGAKKRSINPEWRRKNKEALQKIDQDPEVQIKRKETRVKGFWYGNVDNEPPERAVYCILWEEVNPRVHAFFNYECCLCHIPENGCSHAGHHVFFVKEACCWQTEEGIYYTNLNAKDHPEHDYFIGTNPNYFVILCPSCHGKMGQKFEKRKKWADYFREMIDNEYDGKCYLTEEEMREYTASRAV